MKSIKFIVLMCMMLLVCVALFSQSTAKIDLERADTEYKNGNYRDALDIYQKILTVKEDIDGEKLVTAFQNAVNAQRRLNRVKEFDTLAEKSVLAYNDCPELIFAVSNGYISVSHSGSLINNEFVRNEWGGLYRTSVKRDNVRAIQLHMLGIKLLETNSKNNEKTAQEYINLAEKIRNLSLGQTWKLQLLTDLDVLPDYEEDSRYIYYGNYSNGAPIDLNGNPMFYYTPKTFVDAKNDGERYRYCLEKAISLSKEDAKYSAHSVWAEFLNSQFGVHTFAGVNIAEADPFRKNTSGTFELATLTDSETIARLANGVKRFKLPNEFNYIYQYKQVEKSKNKTQVSSSRQALAQIYLNRRQYKTAAEYYKKIDDKNMVEQIKGNWIQIMPIETTHAGKNVELTLRYRNAKEVTFIAKQVDMEKVFAKLKNIYQGKETDIDIPNGSKLSSLELNNIANYLCALENSDLFTEKTLTFKEKLSPNSNHFDVAKTIITPIKEVGVWYITATAKDGNTITVIANIEDIAIVQQSIAKQNETYFYVADAVTGIGIDKATIEFFGYNNYHNDNNKPAYNNINFAEFTDNNGGATINNARLDTDYRWIIVARKDDKITVMGNNQHFYNNHNTGYYIKYNNSKCFVLTDRPVYRPDNTAKIKFWANTANYGFKEEESIYKGKVAEVKIYDPNYQIVKTQTVELDKFGGGEIDLELEKDAALGAYSVQVNILKDEVSANQKAVGKPISFEQKEIILSGHISFRVEEYKKPEYEVIVDAPTEPIKLGDTISATISAKYYFGEPVSGGTVNYKVLRTASSRTWYPIMRFDWLYGRGYAVAGYDTTFYPGFSIWGCVRPTPYWFGYRAAEQPEVVADGTANLNSDGTFSINIDTKNALANNPDKIHTYAISAEVYDSSNRIVNGSGSVMASSTPFKVYGYSGCGYYRAGDTLTANFTSLTTNSRPVSGKGTLTIYSIEYKKDKNNNITPTEKTVQSFKIDPDENGSVSHRFVIPTAGQYRVSYLLRDWNGNSSEGAYIVNVIGENFKSSTYQFTELELIPDKPEYKVGDKAKLLINTNCENGIVLLQLRAENGIYMDTPQLIKLNGKSTVIEIDIEDNDMPNFFVDATTVYNGKTYFESRQIIVPPVDRSLTIDISPDKEIYEPGETAKVYVSAVDADNLPVSGDLAITMYDRSIEYISGGSNVADIKQFFWSFKRYHNPNIVNSLSKINHNIFMNKKYMQQLGIYGNNILEFFDDSVQVLSDSSTVNRYELAMSLGRVSGNSFESMKMTAAFDGPSGPAAPMAEKSMGGGAGENGNADDIALRTNFADSAYFNGTVHLDENGRGYVEIKMPDNLTSWKIYGWVMGAKSSVGSADITVNTKKSLMIRPDTPRFLVDGDTVTLSAMVDNYTGKEVDIKTTLTLYGVNIESIDNQLPTLADVTINNEKVNANVSEKIINVKANTTAKVDWQVKVNGAGDLNLRYTATADGFSDGTLVTIPVKVYGALVTDSYSADIKKDEATTTLKLTVPEERDKDLSSFELRYSPSLAVAMIDALPYVTKYPYNHADAIVQRFIPAVLTKDILNQIGVTFEELNAQTTNLNAQQIGNDKERIIDSFKRKTYGYVPNREPIFSGQELDALVKSSLVDIQRLQSADGGFKWYNYSGAQSSPHTTAIILRGLTLANKNGIAVVPGTIEKAVSYLTKYQDEQLRCFKLKPGDRYYRSTANALDVLVYTTLIENGVNNSEIKDKLYNDRLKLPVYALALLGTALYIEGDNDEKLEMVLNNVDQYLIIDTENQTAYLDMGTNNYWWCWYGDNLSANAAYLSLLSKVDPHSDKASGLVKYLLNNRKNQYYWHNLNDTTNIIVAFYEYIKATGELNPDLSVTVKIDGKTVKNVRLTRENIFSFDNRVFLNADEITSGEHTVEVIKEGHGSIYLNAYLTNFSQEKPIPAKGLEIKIDRTYYLLTEEKKSESFQNISGNPYEGKTTKYKRTQLKEGQIVKPTDLVEVELTVVSKNDYDCIQLDDYRPAGFENAELLSGYIRNAYMEMRDDRNVMFINMLRQGTTTFTYRMRAVNLGIFSALPATAKGIYAPELVGNSKSAILEIR